MQATNNSPLTTLSGCPVGHNKNSLTAGPNGPVLMQDYFLMEKIKQFTQEKTPARNVHALGYGAHGVFTATNSNVAKYSCAKVFEAGTKTPFVSRFSGVFTEQGEPDTNRDLRGLALKFKTTEGIWDLLCVNTPIFNCRDMKIGPDAVHALKRDPQTGMTNPNQLWDFIGQHPEALHHTLMLYTDRVGQPASFRNQSWWAANTYSFWNSKKERFFVRYHIITDLPITGLTQAQTKLIAGEDPNFLGRDLWDNIEAGNFPRWKMSVQIMTEEQGYATPFAFDCTKAWKHEDFPLIELGTIEVNQNPLDFHAEIEQVAFSPARVVPGLGYSPDKLLQGRLLVYDDTQIHRLGSNYRMIPVNCPFSKVNSNYITGGPMNVAPPKDNFPHYSPSGAFDFSLPKPDVQYMESAWRTDGPADFYNLPGEGTDLDYYAQAREFLTKLDEKDFTNMCFNIASSLGKTIPRIQAVLLAHLEKINPKLVSTIQTFIAQSKEVAPLEGERMVNLVKAELAQMTKGNAHGSQTYQPKSRKFETK